jgi:hypothetical protein
MRSTHEHFKNYDHHADVKLPYDTLEHLKHLAIAPIKNIIPPEHLETLEKHGYVKQVLGGHIPTDKGHMKLMKEGL